MRGPPRWCREDPAACRVGSEGLKQRGRQPTLSLRPPPAGAESRGLKSGCGSPARVRRKRLGEWGRTCCIAAKPPGANAGSGRGLEWRTRTFGGPSPEPGTSRTGFRGLGRAMWRRSHQPKGRMHRTPEGPVVLNSSCFSGLSPRQARAPGATPWGRHAPVSIRCLTVLRICRGRFGWWDRPRCAIVRSPAGEGSCTGPWSEGVGGLGVMMAKVYVSSTIADLQRNGGRCWTGCGWPGIRRSTATCPIVTRCGTAAWRMSARVTCMC